MPTASPTREKPTSKKSKATARTRTTSHAATVRTTHPRHDSQTSLARASAATPMSTAPLRKAKSRCRRTALLSAMLFMMNGRAPLARTAHDAVVAPICGESLPDGKTHPGRDTARINELGRRAIREDRNQDPREAPGLPKVTAQKVEKIRRVTTPSTKRTLHNPTGKTLL